MSTQCFVDIVVVEFNHHQICSFVSSTRACDLSGELGNGAVKSYSNIDGRFQREMSRSIVNVLNL